MSSENRLLEIIKQASTEAVGAAKPFALTYGVVTSVKPLSIQIDQKLELGEAQLILTNAVRDYSVEMSVEHWVEMETEYLPEDNMPDELLPNPHRHRYLGKKKFAVHLGLREGEQVLLLRVQGGQQYIVFDRSEALT